MPTHLQYEATGSSASRTVLCIQLCTSALFRLPQWDDDAVPLKYKVTVKKNKKSVRNKKSLKIRIGKKKKKVLEHPDILSISYVKVIPSLYMLGMGECPSLLQQGRKRLITERKRNLLGGITASYHINFQRWSQACKTTIRISINKTETTETKTKRSNKQTNKTQEFSWTLLHWSQYLESSQFGDFFFFLRNLQALFVCFQWPHAEY